MFKDKRFLVLFLVELLSPLLINIPGIPAFITFHDSNMKAFEIFYQMAMILGLLIIFTEWILNLLGFSKMIINIMKKSNEKYLVSREVVNWIVSGIGMLTAMVTTFLVNAFTYGMGV